MDINYEIKAFLESPTIMIVQGQPQKLVRCSKIYYNLEQMQEIKNNMPLEKLNEDTLNLLNNQTP